MNLTIPIRANSSTSSLSRDVRGNSLKRAHRLNRQRYIFSMTTAIFVTGTLVMGGVGSIATTASAHEKNSNYAPSAPVTVVETAPKVEPAVVPPVVQPVQPPAAPTVAPVAPVTPAPASTPPAQRSVVQPAVVQPVVTPAPVDTAPEIVTMTAAQAANDSQPVTYTNERMSFVTRDRLIILAAVAATTGALLYTMSLIGTSPRTRLIGVIR
ncbi:hypothetical protein H7200_01040 [Candidatus Saccharibacteria bacterium]|nr:hypothetical protein [Candidatus Saccharibacteria bacterium]